MCMLDSLSRSHPLGLDRGEHKRRRASLRGLRSRILRQISRSLELRWWNLGWYGRWSRSSLRNHGFLHVHEDCGDDQAQGGCEGREGPRHHGHLHGYLQKGGYRGYQQGSECCGCTTSHELGKQIRLEQSCVSARLASPAKQTMF